jgi:hypothetical protein
MLFQAYITSIFIFFSLNDKKIEKTILKNINMSVLIEMLKNCTPKISLEIIKGIGYYHLFNYIF